MLLESFAQDMRIGLRVLIKEKGFCAMAVSVLALGICAVATQYAVVNGVLLHAFTFRDADRLVDVQLVDPKNFTPSNFNSRVTTADFAELRDKQTSFSEFIGYLNGSTVNLTWNGNPIRLQGAYITHDFFRALGVAPVLGRDFLPEEDRPGVDKAVILSDALWRSDFGRDPNVLGKTVRVNGRAGVIVGVMPPKFQFPTNEQLWIPVNTEFPVKPRNDRGINFIAIIARLKAGVSLEQAQAELTTIAQQFAEAYPETNKQFTMGYIRPLIGAFTGGQLTGLLVTMLAFCIAVLLIACVNVMNMQFARATLRAKELAIRSSLGATRTRLIRQMLTESLLVATLGAAIGIALAFYATDYLNQTVHNTTTNQIPSWMIFSIDARVLLVIVAATVLAAIVSGLVPAWLASRASAVEVLKESGRGNTGRAVNAITKILVVLQISLTSLLLIGALLQTQSIIRQQAIDYGYDTGAILATRMGLMEGDYPTSEKRQLFYERLLRELRATPQFEAVALTNRFRMVFSGGGPMEIEGKEYKANADRTNVQFENVTPGYFNVLGVKIVEGRDLTDDDSDQKLPVAVITATFAQKHFGNQSPIGRRFRNTAPDGTNPGPWRTIIGVVQQIRMQGPFNNNNNVNRVDGSGYFMPYFASAFGPVPTKPVAQQFGTAVVRPRNGQRPEALAAALQAVVSKVDPNLPVYFTSTPKEAIDGFLTQNRIIAALFAIFGAVAVLLASIGLYGVMSFSVNQRTQEFGIRMALGADNNSILAMVLRQGGIQIVIGLCLGLGLTLAIAVIGDDGIRQFLTGISPRDPLTYIAVAVLLAVVSLVATLVPARRATRVDPMIALRAE
jgi:putative ABC transport system permease protein